MKSQEEIRTIAKLKLRRSFIFSDEGNKHMFEKYNAQYEVLCRVLELSPDEEEALWNEVADSYMEKMEG